MKDLTGHWNSDSWDWDCVDIDSFDDYDEPDGKYLVRDDHGPLNRFSDKDNAKEWMRDAMHDGYDLPLYLDDLDLEIVLWTLE